MNSKQEKEENKKRSNSFLNDKMILSVVKNVHKSLITQTIEKEPTEKPIPVSCSMQAKNPEVLNALSEVGRGKCNRTFDQIFLLGINAGAFIALGGYLALVVGGNNPGLSDYPGISKLLFGGTFPVGLLLVILTGAELFTGNVMVCPLAVIKGKASLSALIKNWFWSYSGNLVGSLLFAYFFVFIHFQNEVGNPTTAWVKKSISIAEAKCNKGWYQLIFLGMAANWLVALAIWCAVASKDTGGKFFGIWFPIMAFVACGFEHSIANMFFVPLGMMFGGNVTFQGALYNIFLVTIGNILGSLFQYALVMYYVVDLRQTYHNAIMNSVFSFGIICKKGLSIFNKTKNGGDSNNDGDNQNSEYKNGEDNENKKKLKPKMGKKNKKDFINEDDGIDMIDVEEIEIKNDIHDEFSSNDNKKENGLIINIDKDKNHQGDDNKKPKSEEELSNVSESASSTHNDIEDPLNNHERILI